MRRAGISYEKGFKHDGLKDFRDQFLGIVNQAEKNYFDATLGKMTREEMVKLSEVYVELWAIFFITFRIYYRKIRSQTDSSSSRMNWRTPELGLKTERDKHISKSMQLDMLCGWRLGISLLNRQLFGIQFSILAILARL